LSVGNGLRGNVLSDTMDKRIDVPAQTISAVEKERMRPDKFWAEVFGLCDASPSLVGYRRYSFWPRRRSVRGSWDRDELT
jgi:hypothetical protein